MENYVSFYTSKPFWTCEKPDVNLISKDPIVFNSVLSERTLEYKDDGLYLAFCKDGLIMTQIGKVEDKRQYFKNLIPEKEPVHPNIQYTSEYLDYLNAIQVLLASATIQVEKLDYFTCGNIFNGNSFVVTFENGKFSGSGVPEGAGAYYYMGRNYSQYLTHNYPVSFDQRIIFRNVLSKNVFDELWKNFKVAYHNEELIRILSLINSAYSEYKNLNFRQALIESWFVIEFLINKKWESFLTSKRKTFEDERERINFKRKELLTGRDYTASVMTNILELNDLIKFDLLQKIDNVRNKRNNVVHSLDLLAEFNSGSLSSKGKQIRMIDCWDAFFVIMEFVKSEYEIDLLLSPQISYKPLPLD